MKILRCLNRVTIKHGIRNKWVVGICIALILDKIKEIKMDEMVRHVMRERYLKQ